MSGLVIVIEGGVLQHVVSDSPGLVYMIEDRDVLENEDDMRRSPSGDRFGLDGSGPFVAVVDRPYVDRMYLTIRAADSDRPVVGLHNWRRHLASGDGVVWTDSRPGNRMYGGIIETIVYGPGDTARIVWRDGEVTNCFLHELS